MMYRFILTIQVLCTIIFLCACSTGHSSNSNTSDLSNSSSEEFCTVTFDPQNGEPSLSIQVKRYMRINKNEIPFTPIKNGWDFCYWYYQNNKYSYKFDFNSQITKDITLYAQWKISTYTISYILDGGKFNIIPKYQYTIEDYIELPTKEDIEKYKSNFEGWYENSDYTGEIITKIEKGSVGNKTYYVKWTTNIEDISVFLESVSGDKEITIEIKNDYLTATIKDYTWIQQIESSYWKIDGEKIIDDTSNTYPFQLYFGNLDAGYHNATLVIITKDGNIYSATAVISITK